MIFNEKEIGLLNEGIPKYERIKPGFISILKAHSETNLTNFLTYLFKGEDYPQLQEIFLQSFIDCINLDHSDDNFLNEMLDDGFKDIKVYPEYQTKFGKIDILIVKESGRKSKRIAIIIENKLYHELNNDFDDYFLSVCNDLDIFPKNIAVVALSLKPFNYAFPNYMKHGKVLHSELKEAILKELGINGSIKKNRSAQFFVNEYIKHIEDLYLERAVYSNEKCIKFYRQNRKLINSILIKAIGMSFGEFEKGGPSDKRELFDFQQKIGHLSQMKNSVNNYALESFNHYLTLTERKVQGPGYFRGRGLAFDAIRYKLDFQNYFNNEDQISLEVWLNGKFLSDRGIDIKDISFQSAFNSIGVTLTDVIDNGWFKIHTGAFDIDNKNLTNIFRDKIDIQWDELETTLSLSIAKNLNSNFNEIVISFLDDQRGFEYKIIEDGKAVQFAYTTTMAFYQYCIKYTPPDLIEIILYVENSAWEDIERVISHKKGFIKFTQAQSYQIPELKDEQLGGYNRNYDALLKKSYRIKNFDEVKNLFIGEKPIWTEVEVEITKIIENIDPE